MPEVGLQPLRLLGSSGNMRNPARSGTDPVQSETRGMDIVHTPI